MKNLTLTFALLVLLACEIKPSRIQFDYDQCHACKMTISDQRFACQLVNDKGKAFKFDAIECMIPEIHRKGIEYYSLLLVSDHQDPGRLIDAESAQYLISKDRPSPMGAFLSAYRPEYNLEIEMKNIHGEKLSFQDLMNSEQFNY